MRRGRAGDSPDDHGDAHQQASELPQSEGADDSTTELKNMEDAAVVGRIFYYVFHGMINLILMLYDNDLRDQIISLDLFWPIVYVGLTASSTYLFHNAKKRPGYLRHEKSPSELNCVMIMDEDDAELGNHNNMRLDVHESKETMPTIGSTSITPRGLGKDMMGFMESKDNQPRGDVIMPRSYEHGVLEPASILARMKEAHLQAGPGGTNKQGACVMGEERYSEQAGLMPRAISDVQVTDQQASEQDVSIASEDFSAMSQLPPGKRHCDKCKIMQNYRTKHCKVCGECVARFDHHCYFIGGCVGELNHRKFWLMLLSMQLQYFMVCKYLWSGLDFNSDSYEEDHPNDHRKYTKEYGAFFMSSVIAFVASGLVSLLLGYHSYLCLLNETTWENVKGSKIDYMNVYPSGYKPFSKGILNNIKTFFFHNNQLTDWEPPEIKQTWKQPNGDTWWKNQYYSCC
jgi:palmitoyltransferase